MPKGSRCDDKNECQRSKRLIQLSELFRFLASSLENVESFSDSEEMVIGGRESTTSEETDILPPDDQGELAENQNPDNIMSELCQLIKNSLLIDREGNATPERIREIRLKIIPILLQLELLEEYLEQEETNIETRRQIDNVIETEISSLLKILLYLPEQPEE